MRAPRTVRELVFEIQFQERNLELFAKWPKSCEASRQLIAQYESQLTELLRPRVLPREDEGETTAV
ncbi:hypothetical protein F183_A29770 [Bryobacterales bacterium F-183]|nr:hypothetical protein F183_A29770 [Bryobacterales bacterium F-183]